MSLKIEQLTEQVEMTKTAEEEAMEKLAETVNVLEQAQALTVIGEELHKLAEETENEAINAIGEDLFNIGSRMGAALTKTATEGNYALLDSLEIAQDLNKVASVLAEIADEAQNEEFTKMASVVVEISNEMTDDANAVIEAMEKEAEEEKKSFGQKIKETAGKAWEGTKKGAKYGFGGGAWKAEDARNFLKTIEGGKWDKVKGLLGSKAGLKSLIRPAIAYGTAAGAATAAGIAAKKYHDKKR